MARPPPKAAPPRAGQTAAPPAAGNLERAGAEAFTELLGEVRTEVDRRLKALWDAKVRELERHGPDLVAMASAARDLTLRGGKRFRAALFVTAFSGVAPRASREPAIRGGVALELFQSYLLMQDDWMDGDATRRGGPSVHAALEKTFGGAHAGASGAILASDLTWSLALTALATMGAPAERVVDVIESFCRVHEDVVIGQGLDMMGRAEDVEAMHALKTGSYTVRGPLVLGAALAGAEPGVIEALERYAGPLGVAFQLRDDLLGTFGATEETGKPYAGDLRAGKRTAVLVEATERLDAEGKRLVEGVLGKAEATEEALRAAASAIEACGARAAVAARLGALCDEAEAIAETLPIAAKAREVLRGAANALRIAAPAPATASARVPATPSARATATSKSSTTARPKTPARSPKRR